MYRHYTLLLAQHRTVAEATLRRQTGKNRSQLYLLEGNRLKINGGSSTSLN
jgi:hypothetical protein